MLSEMPFAIIHIIKFNELYLVLSHFLRPFATNVWKLIKNTDENKNINITNLIL